jgi:uncharacterized protein YjbI with pentapeptide repeats
MALINKPKKSKYQVGETVYLLLDKKIVSSEVVSISSVVTNPNNDVDGIQEDFYYLSGYSRSFFEDDLFDSENALLYNIKGDYLNYFPQLLVFNDMDFSATNLSYCDLSNASYSGANFTSVNYEGSDLSDCVIAYGVFVNANLKNCKFKNDSLEETNFSGANIMGCNFSGANLTSAILPTNANTKSAFKSTVGPGNWDPVTTIWVDGLPIGN